MINTQGPYLLPGFEELEMAALQIEMLECDQYGLVSQPEAEAIKVRSKAFFVKLERLILQMKDIVLKPYQNEIAVWIDKAAKAVLSVQADPSIFRPGSQYEKISQTMHKINHLISDYFFELPEIKPLNEIIAICATENTLAKAEIGALSLQPNIINLSYAEYEQLVQLSLSKGQWNLIKVLSTGGFREAFMGIWRDFIFNWLMTISSEKANQILAISQFLEGCGACLEPDNTLKTALISAVLRACLKKVLETGSLSHAKMIIEGFSSYFKAARDRQDLLHHAAVGGNLELLRYLLESAEICGTLHELEKALDVALKLKHYPLIDYLVRVNPYQLCGAIDYDEWELFGRFYMVIESGQVELLGTLIDAVEVTPSMHPNMLKSALKSGSLEMFTFLKVHFAIMPPPTKLGDELFQHMGKWIAESGSTKLMRLFLAEYPGRMPHELLFCISLSIAALESKSLELLRCLYEEFFTSPQFFARHALDNSRTIPSTTLQWAYLWSIYVDIEYKIYFQKIASGQIDSLDLEALRCVRDLFSRAHRSHTPPYLRSQAENEYSSGPLQMAAKEAIRKKITIQYLFSKFHNGQLPTETLKQIADYIDFSKPLGENMRFWIASNPWNPRIWV